MRDCTNSHKSQKFPPHISALNPYFCELTALYLAWQNPQVLENAEYIGLFHYRRILDFTPNHFCAKLKRLFSRNIIRKFYLDSIPQFITTHKPSIIIPTRLKLSPNFTFYDTYAQDHIIADLDLALEFINAHFPAMKDAINASLFTKGAAVYYANVAIWQKDLFREYCEWLFCVLFGIMERIDYAQREAYQARVFGFLAERLSNVWLYHKMQDSSFKVCELKMRTLYARNKKLFGWVDSREYRRFFVLFVRILKVKKVQNEN